MPIYKSLNKKFFKIWNPSMAYVLGYFAADGNMIRNKRGGYFIEFTSADIKLITQTRRLLGSSHKISMKQKPPKWTSIYRLQIGSKDLYNDLAILGMTPAKSNNMVFPSVPPEFIFHFVRGYFDGDGHVSISVYNRKERARKSKTIISGFTSGSKEFLAKLHIVLKNHADILGGSLYHTKGYHLTFSVEDSKKLYVFMYKNATTLYLARKRIIFEDYFV